MLEGPLLLSEALQLGVPLQEVFAEPGADEDLVQRCQAAGAVVHRLREGVLQRATDAVSPQPLAAVAAMHDLSLVELPGVLGEGAPAMVLVLVGVSDPGNLGTLLRSARAVGARLVVCCDATADPYNPKSVRASAGALFALSLVRDAAAAEAVSILQARQVQCLGAVVQGGEDYDHVDMTGPVALVLGNEAHGLPRKLQRSLDRLVSIPMVAGAESLNVGMAGTVLCFEALRQRRATHRGAIRPFRAGLLAGQAGDE